SDRHSGRRVADCAADTASVADAVGCSRFYTVGWSGGGPHALACAALLPDRILGAATIAGVAPYGPEDLDWFAGMGEDNVAEFNALLAGPEALRAFLDQAAPALRGATAQDIVAALGDLISPVDADALRGPFA